MAGADSVGRWQAGANYGPVLTQTELYLLGTELTLHPILTHGNNSFHLVFNLQTGQTGGFNPDNRDRDLPFTQKDEPATLPRVTELIIITDLSPWCTIVKNTTRGVTLGDMCSAIWKDYTDNTVTDKELAALPPRLQEQIRRSAAHHSQGGWSGFYGGNAQAPSTYRRVDWLRDRVFFEGLVRKDDYAVKRLGYKAPNIFIMNLVS